MDGAAPIHQVARLAARRAHRAQPGMDRVHPGCRRNALGVRDPLRHVGQSLQVMARIRYRQALEAATLYATTEGLYVAFESPQSAITEGQFVAWYLEDELVGSGVIS